MNETFLQDTLTELEGKNLKRQLRLVEGSQGRKITIDGRAVLNFCSNNYLGLADDARLKKVAVESIERDGFGSGASQLVCGHMSAHRKLEEQLARFKGTEAALTFSSGYMANVGTLSALFDRDDIIFSDRLNHASIVDGILLSRAEFKRYPHNDMAAIEEMLKGAAGFKKRCIVTDSVFSMDGDLAPLPEICALAKKYQAFVMIDEAHGFGVLGENGKGAAEYFGVSEAIDIQMGTLSKAAGSFGAYVAGSAELISFLVNRARSFIYTTALPPAVAASSVRAIEIIEGEPQLRRQLWDNTMYLLAQLKQMGFDTMTSQTPIIPILIKDSATAVEFSKRLFEVGIFVSAIRPPTVPVNTARLRLTIMATHTREDLDQLISQLKRIGQDLCLIS